jgi:hypothetical protein
MQGYSVSLVKTINFDAPDVYHLYYETKTVPRDIMTFFPYSGIRAEGRTGQLTVTFLHTCKQSWLLDRKAQNSTSLSATAEIQRRIYIFEDRMASG